MAEKESLIEGYGILLAFDDLLKKLSEIYEVDLSQKLRERIEVIETYIDSHNTILKKATGEMQDKPYSTYWKRDKTLKVNPDFFIDKDAIAPSNDRIKIHLEKFSEIFGDTF